jgi:hypothetical protein
VPEVELMPEGVPKGVPEGRIVPGGGFEDDSMMEEVVTMPEGEICLAAASKEVFFIEIR